MSITTQIQALTQDRADIRSALVTKGVTSATGSGYDDFAEDILNIPDSQSLYSSSLDLTDGYRFQGSTFTTLPEEIAHANWHSVVDARCMFYSCSFLESLPLLDFSNVQRIQNAFSSCPSLVEVGGFIGLKVSASFVECPLLSTASCVRIFENLAFVTGSQTLTFYRNVYDSLTSEQKEIATSKGWTIKRS